MTRERGVWIYGIACSCDASRIRYVGRTMRDIHSRFMRHRNDANRGSALPVHRWLAKHSSHETFFVPLRTSKESLMHVDEIEVIAKFREEGFADLNIRDGGEGFTSESSRELWSQPSHREAMEKARPRISEGARRALVQRWQDPEARARMITLSSVPNPSKSNPGSKNGNSKLAEADVAEIKTKLRLGSRQKDVAREYGVSQSLVSLISRGEAWPHVRVD